MLGLRSSGKSEALKIPLRARGRFHLDRVAEKGGSGLGGHSSATSAGARVVLPRQMRLFTSTVHTMALKLKL